MTKKPLTKFFRLGRGASRCPVTKTGFRNYRKAYPDLSYMAAFRRLGGTSQLTA